MTLEWLALTHKSGGVLTQATATVNEASTRHGLSQPSCHLDNRSVISAEPFVLGSRIAGAVSRRPWGSLQFQDELAPDFRFRHLHESPREQSCAYALTACEGVLIHHGRSDPIMFTWVRLPAWGVGKAPRAQLPRTEPPLINTSGGLVPPAFN